MREGGRGWNVSVHHPWITYELSKSMKLTLVSLLMIFGAIACSNTGRTLTEPDPPVAASSDIDEMDSGTKSGPSAEACIDAFKKGYNVCDEVFVPTDEKEEKGREICRKAMADKLTTCFAAVYSTQSE